MAEDIICNLNPKENEDIFPPWPHRDQDSHNRVLDSRKTWKYQNQIYVWVKNLISAK